MISSRLVFLHWPSATARQPIKSPITQPEMPERTHATATPRPAVSIGSRRTVPLAPRRRRRIETAGRGAALARTRKRSAKVERGSLSEQIQGAVALGQFQNPTECEHSRRLPSGQLLRAAVAEELRHRDLQVPNRKRRRASTSASTRRPGLAARRSATARQPIKSPITQPEMPERTHATATPRPAVSIGSRRTVPLAPRRRRRIETAGRGAALARTRKRSAKVERGSLSEQIQGAVALGQFQNPTECEHSRRLPSGQLLRAAVAEELRHRDLQVPNRKRRRASTSASTRRPGLAARRSAPARQPIKSPITQPEMPERTHAAEPLGQRFRSARAEQSP